MFGLALTLFMYMNMYSLSKYTVDNYLHKNNIFSESLNIFNVKELLKDVFFYLFELITNVLLVPNNL